MLQTISFSIASAMSLLACLAHIFIGTAKNAKPILNDASLSVGPRTTMMFSWESNSVLMGFMAVGFLFGMIKQDTPIIYFVTALTAALAVWGIVVALRNSVNAMAFPPAVLFVIISAFGVLGLLSKS